MGDIPSAIQELEIDLCYRKAIPFAQYFEITDCDLGKITPRSSCTTDICRRYVRLVSHSSSTSMNILNTHHAWYCMCVAHGLSTTLRWQITHISIQCSGMRKD